MPHIGYFPPREFPKPLAIVAGASLPGQEDMDWYITDSEIRAHTALTLHVLRAPVILPHGATLVKATLYGYRDDAQAILRASFVRLNRQNVAQNTIQLNATWTGGYDSVEGTTFNYPQIDNINYDWGLRIEVDPNDAVEDVRFCSFVIDWN